MDYVPAEIVKILFEQSCNAIESNTKSVKEITASVNELAKIMSLPPTKRDILDEVKSHEDKCNIRTKETYQVLDNIIEDDDKKQDACKIEIERQFNNIEAIVKKICNDVDIMKSKVNTMIMIVMIAFSLMSVIYVFVNHSVNSNIKQTISETIKEYDINNNKVPVK